MMLQILEDERLTYSKGRTVDSGTEIVFPAGILKPAGQMIVFRLLTKLEVKEIAYIMLKKVFERLKGKDIVLQVTEQIRYRVVKKSHHEAAGRRHGREIKEGDSVIVVDSDGNVMVLNGSSRPPPEALPEPIEV